MPKPIELSLEEVSKWLRYEPDTGKLFWKIAPARRLKAGAEAGTVKRTGSKSGKQIAYRYIRLQGMETPASRVAWLLHYGEWPETNVLLKDGDSLNLKIENMVPGKFQSIKSDVDGRRVYKMSREAQRHYGLMRYYGMTGEEYGEMVAAQKGLCAICNKPETAMFNGTPKVLHVDHCHATNQIRALLCGSCNGMLGLAKDNPETLRSAADYIEKHAALESRIIPFAAREDPE